MSGVDYGRALQQRRILWFAMIGSVVLLGVVIVALHLSIEAVALSQAIDNNAKMIGMLALLPFPLYNRLGAARRPLGQGATPEDEQRRLLTRMLVSATLAELPVMVALAYAALGGSLVWALAGWGASFLYLLIVNPQSGRVI